MGFRRSPVRVERQSPSEFMRVGSTVFEVVKKEVVLGVPARWLPS
jgi:hypothetical protein